MTMLFVDGMDAGLAGRWDSVGALTSGTGRYGGTYVAPDSGGLRKWVGAYDTLVVGWALQINGTANTMCRLYDGGSVGSLGTLQCDLRVVAGPFFQVTRNGTVLATSTIPLRTNSWMYVELKVKIGSSTGTYEVRVNGVVHIIGSGANTQNTGNALINQVHLTDSTNSRINAFDDVYILNTLGSVNNNFVGEIRVKGNVPTGDGASVQWTLSTGSSHFANVDDAGAHNSDTDYNSDSTVGHIELLTFPTITGDTVLAVQDVFIARKDDVGARQVCEVCRSGSTNFTGATQTMTASYIAYLEMRELDPNTSAAWTVSNVNSAQAGVKTIA